MVANVQKQLAAPSLEIDFAEVHALELLINFLKFFTIQLNRIEFRF